MSGMVPTFAGEVQLAGWSESHNGGCKVVFWLQSSEELDAFRALTVRKGNTAGHRFMAALVEIGDDEKPVAAEPVASTTPGVGPPAKGGERAKLCGIWCNTPDFRDWLKRHFPSAWRLNATHKAERENAASTLRAVLAIESRAEIDNDPAIAERFDSWVRRPYMAHMESRGVAA